MYSCSTRSGLHVRLKCGTTNCANCDLDLRSNVTQLNVPGLICLAAAEQFDHPFDVTQWVERPKLC